MENLHHNSNDELRLSTEEEMMLFASIADEPILRHCYEDGNDDDYQLSLSRPETPSTEGESSSSSRSSPSSATPSSNCNDELILPDLASSSSSRIAKELLRYEGFGAEDCTIPTEEVISAAKTANADELDAIMAKEMSKISLKEQFKATQDVYGLNETKEETPQFVQQKLEEFRCCISQVCRTNSSQQNEAYEQALYLSPEYVNDEDFCLMFLRSTVFDPYKAAKKFVSYFHHKKRLFLVPRDKDKKQQEPGVETTLGADDILVRDISQDDSNDEDIAVLKSGCYQILPERDRADRIVMVADTTLVNCFQKFNRCRAAWYLTMRILKDDIETQKNGLVIVCFITDEKFGSENFFQDLYDIKDCEAIRQSMPYRMIAGHHCFVDQNYYRYKHYASFCMFLVGKQVRQRLKLHFGSKQEAMYMLQTYGIPTHCVRPIDDVAHHLQWLESIQEQEQQELRCYKASSDSSTITDPEGESCYPRSTILVPRRFDVVFGKGKYAAEHTGNLRAFHIVQMNKQAYEKASKLGKTLLAVKIVNLIKGSYGRFLKRKGKGFSGPWIEVDDDTAREKISHYFRRMREIELKQQKEEKLIQEQRQVQKEKQPSTSVNATNKRPTSATTTPSIGSAIRSENSLESTPEEDSPSLKKHMSVLHAIGSL